MAVKLRRQPTVEPVHPGELLGETVIPALTLMHEVQLDCFLVAKAITEVITHVTADIFLSRSPASVRLS